MKRKRETDLLNERLLDVAEQRATDLKQLKEQFQVAYESVKPIALLKTLFHQVTSSADIKNNVVSTAVGLGTGFLSKKLLVGHSHNAFKRGLGTLLQFAVTNFMVKNTERLQAVGKTIKKGFLKHNSN